MTRDWKQFPELRNSEMQQYYWESPHKQITQDFTAKVVKVHDGDTITLEWYERDFEFPCRFLGTDAPELDEDGGHESQKWLESQILNQEVRIIINPKQRVDKWGRILGKILFGGVEMNDESIRTFHATTFEGRNPGELPDLEKTLKDTL